MHSKLTDQEKGWVKSLLSSGTRGKSLQEWLEEQYLKSSLGRALILQSQECFAVLFLSHHIFSDDKRKEEEFTSFMNLIRFLKQLNEWGYLTISRGRNSRMSTMVFIQDEFKNPRKVNEKIVLNDLGDYTENPEIIHDENNKVAYQGIRLDGDVFDLVQTYCTGTVIVSSKIEELIIEPVLEKKEDVEVKPVQKKTGNKKEWIYIVALFCVLFGVGLLMWFGYEMFEKLESNKTTVERLLINHDKLFSKIDSLKHVVENKGEELEGEIEGDKEIAVPKPEIEKWYYGIDLSHWNGDVAEKLSKKDSLTYVFCKATQGSENVDPEFFNNWDLIKEHGLIRGAYHFYLADDDPIKQAVHFVETMGKLHYNDISPVLDIEQGSLSLSSKNDKVKLQFSLLKFLEKVEALTTRTPVIYTDVAFAEEYLTSSTFSDYPLWIADYNGRSEPYVPTTWGEKGVSFWQKTDSYAVEGEKVDYDVYYGELENIFSPK